MQQSVLLLFLALVVNLSEAGIHEEPLGSWCEHGSTTATTEECVCSVHKGFHCVGSGCQDGFGMSFFAKSCNDCRCDLNNEWKERKGAMRNMIRQEREGNGNAAGGGGKRGPGGKKAPRRKIRRLRTSAFRILPNNTCRQRERTQTASSLWNR